MSLDDLVRAFCEEVEREEQRRQHGPGGQQVTPTGDFVSAPPSVMRKLAIWARQMRSIVGGVP